MVDATCKNENCEKGTWTLTKHPDDYARGVSCPNCGTTRIDLEDYEPRDQPSQPQQREEPAQSQQQAQTPARREPAEQAQQVPAQQGGAFDQVLALGDPEAQPEEKAGAIARIGAAAGQVLGKSVLYNAEKKRQRQERASQASIERVENKPECECGYVFSEVGANDDRVQCPQCGAEYEVYVE